jgi:hypothetical protein
VVGSARCPGLSVIVLLPAADMGCMLTAGHVRDGRTQWSPVSPLRRSTPRRRIRRGYILWAYDVPYVDNSKCLFGFLGVARGGLAGRVMRGLAGGDGAADNVREAGHAEVGGVRRLASWASLFLAALRLTFSLATSPGQPSGSASVMRASRLLQTSVRRPALGWVGSQQGQRMHRVVLVDAGLARDLRQSATPPLSTSRDALHVSREDSQCAAGPRAQSAYRLLLAEQRSKSYVAHGCPGVPRNRSRW